MIIIKDTLEWITNYRNQLVRLLQFEMDVLTHDLRSKNKDAKVHKIMEYPYPEKIKYISMYDVMKFMNEIDLCNAYIEYLTYWHLHYSGPNIPFNNVEVIKTMDQFIYREGKDNFWLTRYNTERRIG